MRRDALNRLFVLPFVIASCLLADDSPTGPEEEPLLVLDPVVVTARGRAATLSGTPGGAGVVLPDEIFLDQPLSLANVARRIPGVEKSSDSAWGSALSIRGLDRNRVVFLVDGCRVNTATDINARFGMIDSYGVERLEVLKGPISALYGSGSIGGVVNVITKRGHFTEQPEWHGTMMGTYSSNPAGPGMYGDATYSTENYWLYASGSFRHRNDYNDADGDEVPNSQFEDWQGKLHLGLKWDSANVTEFQIQHMEADEVGIPGMGLSLPVGPKVTYPDSSRTLFSLTHTVTPGNGILTESKLNLYYQKIERRVRIDEFPTGTVNEIYTEADHDTVGMRWQNVFELAPHTIVAGADCWEWRYDGTRTKYLVNGNVGVDTPLAKSRQISAGLFAEDDWALTETVTLNTGARIDSISSHSDEIYDWIKPPGAVVPTLKRDAEDRDDVSWAAHLGGTWQFMPQWSMTLIGASSYRTPDLMDRYKYLNLGGAGELYGNPDLDPERSLFFEYGLHYTAETVRVSTSVFDNVVDDLIVDPSPGVGVRQLENVDKAEIYGIEEEVEWHFYPQWIAYGNIAYTRGKNRTADDDLSFIPPLNGLAGVRYEPKQGLWGALELDWAATQNKVNSTDLVTDGWVTLDAKLGYRFEAADFRHEIVLAADNIFNTDYRNHLSTSRGFELREPGFGCSATWKMNF